MKKYLLLPLMMLLVSLVAVAQGKPVTFKVSQKRVSPTEVEIAFTGNIASGWHVYAMNLGGDGPTEASFNVDSKSGVELVGGLKAQGKEIAKFDKLFNMNVRYFENSVTFVQRVKLTAKDYSLKGYLEYGACDDAQCLPPTAVDVKVEGSDGPAGTATPPLPRPHLRLLKKRRPLRLRQTLSSRLPSSWHNNSLPIAPKQLVWLTLSLPLKRQPPLPRALALPTCGHR